MSVSTEEVTSAHNMTSGSNAASATGSLPRQSSLAGSSPKGTIAPNGPTSIGTSNDVVRSGYLRKWKGKKKFFVLRKETDSDTGKPARLEYYPNEKKFRMGTPPRKSIVLKTCFNISGPESNLKTKYSISLHTHNDCVRISLSNEEELNDWLRDMKSLAGEEEDDDAIEVKPHFEHIWMVQALNKGLGSQENIIGPYRLCLTSKELTLLKIGEREGRNGQVVFPLNVIRNVSHDAAFGCFFHIEVGRLACTGPGQLSLRTDDNNIAQNMHLLILKAMQNYSKDDIIPRDRARTYTWGTNSTSMRPSHTTPPGMMSCIDEPGRTRTDSLPSASRIIGIGQVSPPVPILSSPTAPSIIFNSPGNMYSTGTDSASSSYSIDYDNNNQHYAESDKFVNGEDEDYVPFSPLEDQHISPKNVVSMKLPLTADGVEEVDGKDSASSQQTPSSFIPSPSSPFDNYLPMSPGGAAAPVPTGITGIPLKSNGKISISHSRNSSLVEDTDGYVPMTPGCGNNDGYVPMTPGCGNNSRSESGAGSIAGSATGLEDSYLDMDFSRKVTLSNDDIRRASPISCESLQSNTPSSDFPLEKVTSYLSDDFDDSMRPIRAYSVGSRSDTTAAGKLRYGKTRLEAVPETFRIRAMSVGSKAPRKPTNLPSPAAHPHPNIPAPAPSIASSSGSNKSIVGGALSSSWSGSTGRYLSKHLNSQLPNAAVQTPLSSKGDTDSQDSDLMELDFSKNKKIRKRSIPGPPLNSVLSSISSLQKISPMAQTQGSIISPLSEGFPSSESFETLKSPQSPTSVPMNVCYNSAGGKNPITYGYRC